MEENKIVTEEKIEEKRILTLDKAENASITRKDFLSSGKKFASGLAGFGILSAFSLSCKDDTKEEKNNDTGTQVTPYLASDETAKPLTYAKITAASDYQELAYLNWYEEACMFAVVSALVKAQRDLSGSDSRFSTVPLESFIWGHGGGVTWGTTCGTINGAASFIAMVLGKDGDGLIRDLFGWYANTMLPIYTPANLVYAGGKNLTQNKSNSPLCHVSVGTWMSAQQSANGNGSDGNPITFGSAERRERCARLSADVVGKTIELLNGQANGTYTAKNKKPQDLAAVGHPSPQYNCNACHGSAGSDYSGSSDNPYYTQ